jgi:mono/diheme cytochrome c family protein
MYKFKTSGPDEMPFDQDLYRTISAGIPAASMPSFGDLTVFERWALVAYTKQLTRYTMDDGRVLDHFGRSPAKTAMAFPEPPDRSRIDLAKGRELFRTGVQCMKCHGENGLGDGPAAPDLVDVFDRPIKTPDMTRGEVSFKAGHRPEDIFRVLTSGMSGTPMPAFTTISEEDRWNLAFYVTSLYRPIPPGERVYLKVGCTSCHTIGQGKVIGPDLAGTMQRRTPDWLRRWLKDPPTMIATDPDARKLFEEYLVPMPSYGLTNREIEHLLDFMKTLPPAPASGRPGSP